MKGVSAAMKPTRADKPSNRRRRSLRGFVNPFAPRNQRGVALLIVLVMLAILTAFTTEFSYNTRVNLKAALNVKQEVQAYYHARSSIEVSRMVIRAQAMADQMLSLAAQFMPNVKSQTIEMWSYACKFADIYNSGKVNLFGQDIIDLSSQTGIGVKNGGFSCVAEAEDGKVNINFVETPQSKKALFGQLFGYMQGTRAEGVGWSKEDREKAEVLLNIIDWVDPDEVRTEIDPTGNFVDSGGGSEDFGYAQHDYECKNAKFDSVDELRLVEGIDDETFCRMRDKVTVYSTEKLNVNAANIDLLKAVVCESMPPESQAVACIAGLGGAPGLGSVMDIVGEYIELCRNLKSMLYTTPFSSINSFLKFFDKLPPEVGSLVQVDKRALGQVLGTRSRIIRINGTGTVGRTEKRISAVIDTSTGKYVYWREE